MDGHRIDKFLMLVRFHYQEVLGVIRDRGCEAEMIKEFMDVLYEECMWGLNVPIGIGMQCADVFMEEIDKCFAHYDEFEFKQEAIEEMLDPFLKTMKFTHSNELFMRIKKKVFEKFISANGVSDGDEPEAQSKVGYLKCFDIVPYAESKIFKVASSKETYELHRDDIYEIYEKAAGKHESQTEPKIPLA